MLKYSTERVLSLVPLVVLIALAAFGLTYLVPGDAAATVAGENATPERVAQVRAQLGLDRPLLEQFGRWLAAAVRGDFGDSLVNRVPVSTLISSRFGVTLSLLLGGLIVSALIGIPAGVIAGLRAGRLADRVITVFTTVWLAVPAFWIAILMIDLLAVDHGWFPAGGYESFTKSPTGWLHHMALPAIAIGMAGAAEIARQTRSAVADVASLDHVRTSRAFGLPERRVVGRHIMKNSAIQIVTSLGLQIGRLLASAVVIERMFAIPGLGELTLNSVLVQDIPTIQGVVVVVGLIVLTSNLVVDLSYGLLNPRLRHR